MVSNITSEQTVGRLLSLEAEFSLNSWSLSTGPPVGLVVFEFILGLDRLKGPKYNKAQCTVRP